MVGEYLRNLVHNLYQLTFELVKDSLPKHIWAREGQHHGWVCWKAWLRSQLGSIGMMLRDGRVVETGWSNWSINFSLRNRLYISSGCSLFLSIDQWHQYLHAFFRISVDLSAVVAETSPPGTLPMGWLINHAWTVIYTYVQDAFEWDDLHPYISLPPFQKCRNGIWFQISVMASDTSHLISITCPVI